MGVHDLNFDLPACEAPGFDRPGVMHERGQDASRAGNGVRAVEDLRAHRREAQGRRNAGIRTLSCADLFRVMAFAQITWRESLRDIDACLAANQGKLFHMGMKASPARSTLAEALNTRYWRIFHALAQRLIVRAKALYADQPSVLDLDASVYVLDSTTIDLCLSLFDWAPPIHEGLRVCRRAAAVDALHQCTEQSAANRCAAD